MTIALKRAYQKPNETDGKRILVERLWPRGLRKEKARIDEWPKEIAPSSELRKWYSHDPDKWPEFKRRYWLELKAENELVRKIVDDAKKGNITFVFGLKKRKS